MSRVVRRWIPVVVASVTALLVLLGYLFPTIPVLAHWRGSLVEWAVIVAAFAFALGLFNILRVHGGRVFRRGQRGGHSLVLLIAALVAWVPPVLYGPSSLPSQRLLEYAIGPVGASLAALIVFALALAAFRLLRTRRGVGALFFVLIAVLALLGSAPLAGLEWMAEIRAWIVNVPGTAGMRGLLLGVALGTVMTALRVVLGTDRPHSEL